MVECLRRVAGEGRAAKQKKNLKTDLDVMINNKMTTCLSNLEWTESDDKNSSDSQIGLGLRPRLVSVWLFSEFISFSHYFEIDQLNSNLTGVFNFSCQCFQFTMTMRFKFQKRLYRFLSFLIMLVNEGTICFSFTLILVFYKYCHGHEMFITRFLL